MANSPTPCGIEDIPVQVPSVIKQLCIALFLFCDQFISFYINILFKTTLIFCSSNWRPIHANSFPPLYSPRFHTHIGSLWFATAWGKPLFSSLVDFSQIAKAIFLSTWIINDKPSHLVVTVDPVSTLMLMSLQRELAGTNMCWPVFVPQITAKIIMMKIRSCNAQWSRC